MKFTRLVQVFVWAVGFIYTLKGKQAVKWAKGRKYEYVTV